MKPRDTGYISEPTPPLRRERGSLLTLWLGFFLFANGFFLYAAARQGNWLSAAWSLFGLVCGFGVLNWRKLAYYGMLLGFGYNIASNLDARSIQGIMFNLTFIALTVALIHPKREMFR